jgi:hypothetical protein
LLSIQSFCKVANPVGVAVTGEALQKADGSASSSQANTLHKINTISFIVDLNTML